MFRTRCLLSALAVAFAAAGCVDDPGASEEVTSELTSGPTKIDCGATIPTAPWVADVDFPAKTGSGTISHANVIDLSAVTNPAPQAVYQTGRTGAVTYTIPGFAAGSKNTVRLHFAETYFTAAGARVFNVAINGASFLANFDIWKTAAGGAKGAKGTNKAVIRELTTAPNASGQYVIAFTNVTNVALISGIEIVAGASTCTAGTACTPTNTCQKGTISCTTGSPVCVASGADTSKNGAACGTNQVCDNGTCASCTAGVACTPANACHKGTVSCSTGTPVCTDTGANAADGTSCGPANTCQAGTCTCHATTATVPAPAAYYPLDADANDVDGNHFVGEADNLYLTTGLLGSSYFFNGTLDTVDNSGVGAESFLYLGLGPSQLLAGARTVCSWIGEYPPASGPGMAIFSVERSPTQYTHLVVNSSAPSGACGGANEIVMVDGSNGCQRSGLVVDPSAWNYVCYAYDGGTHATFYVNGKTSTLTVPTPTVPVWNGNIYMGNAQEIDANVQQGAFYGFIDEVTLWSSYVPTSSMNVMFNGGLGCRAP